MLPKFWQFVSMFNPVVYLISGFRWAFYDNSDVPIVTSLLAIMVFTGLCILIIFVIFKTGWRLRP
jgi:ABC-2 type transport system permease protein